MEIHNQPIQGPRPQRRGVAEQAIDLTRPNREGIQRVKEEYEAEQADVLELSDEARALAEAAEETDASEEAARRQRVEELRRDYLEGRLNTPERVERAAQKLLAGE